MQTQAHSEPLEAVVDEVQALTPAVDIPALEPASEALAPPPEREALTHAPTSEAQALTPAVEALTPPGVDQKVADKEAWQKQKELLSEDRIIFGAIGGLALAFIVELSGGDDPQKLDPLLKAALYCCSFLVPISIIAYQIFTLEHNYQKRVDHPTAVLFILMIMVMICYIVVAIVLWYFDPFIALSFLFFSVCGFIYYFNVSRQLKGPPQKTQGSDIRRE